MPCLTHLFYMKLKSGMDVEQLMNLHLTLICLGPPSMSVLFDQRRRIPRVGDNVPQHSQHLLVQPHLGCLGTSRRETVLESTDQGWDIQVNIAGHCVASKGKCGSLQDPQSVATSRKGGFFDIPSHIETRPATTSGCFHFHCAL